MRFFTAIFLTLILVQVEGFGQDKPVQLGVTGSDCIGALTIPDTLIGPVYSPKGFGNNLELVGYELGDPYFIQREHNSVWYKFTIPYDCVFTFDLIPIQKDDDFDFLLFLYDGPNFCRDITAGRKIPIRTNISRKNIEVQGQTGMSESSVDEYVPSGPGSSYSRALKARRGQTFYLLIDNPFRENEGHSIHLHYRRLKPIAEGQEPSAVEEEEYQIPLRTMRVTVTDKETGERIQSNVFIDNLPDSLPSRYPFISQVSIDVLSYRTYDINVIKKGYLLHTEQFIPKNDSLYEINVQLKRMRKGDRINLGNIKFESDQAFILAKSKPALEKLAEFMIENDNVTIEIQGHVNGEAKKNKRSYISLSEERAEAIYQKLSDAGVDQSRMTFKGFGNAKMIYPNPVNTRQSEANRRVEAEIVEL
ncbi:MAG: outer membrane protein OmpA-like peptidoglycan-associated protein [Flammeovirgaceae bacterium]|jgi:outer membrane protein OmpA-like peptidoglycan-associated protein